MADASDDIEARFLNRIERRVSFLKALFIAELGIYLSPDDQQRRRSIEMLVRVTAKQNELPHIKPATLKRAVDLMQSHLEAMQKVLPHDVQYRNRLKRTW